MKSCEDQRMVSATWPQPPELVGNALNARLMGIGLHFGPFSPQGQRLNLPTTAGFGHALDATPYGIPSQTVQKLPASAPPWLPQGWGVNHPGKIG